MQAIMIKFEKYKDGLAPAVVQDSHTRQVLMVGFMNAEALELTLATGLVTFFSRSRQELWTKGETSGNRLSVNEILTDCDSDTILVKATPAGPACHTGTDTCFGERNEHADRLFQLESVIDTRRRTPTEGSYTSELFSLGLKRIAQKVGEEAVELIIESTEDDLDRFRSEAADLLFHFLVLCSAKGVTYQSVLDVLEKREKKPS
jgi:phosphoribosyl-ATP pyrophosphohydrolase/phosphoribosyl-AMP cyclohydrolase